MRFSITSPLSPDELVRRLREQTSAVEVNSRLFSFSRRAQLTVDGDRISFLAPANPWARPLGLFGSIRHAGQGCIVEGEFRYLAPRPYPAAWDLGTGFDFWWIAAGVIGLILTLRAVVDLFAGRVNGMIWLLELLALPAAIVLAVVAGRLRRTTRRPMEIYLESQLRTAAQPDGSAPAT